MTHVDKFYLWLARKLPQRLLMWVYICIMADAGAIIGNKTADELTYSDVYKALFEGKEGGDK